MNRRFAWISVSGLFLLGVLIGALGMHVYRLRNPPPPPGLGLREFRIEQFAGILELTEDQQREIDVILRAGRHEAREIHEEVLPRVRGHMRGVHERILAILTPEQQDKLDELHRLHRGRFERFLLTGPHGGPAPDGPLQHRLHRREAAPAPDGSDP